MPNDKKYYWLKMKDDFFRNKEIKKLRKIAGGDTYTIIYQKMLLLSLTDAGNIFFERTEKDIYEQLALELDEIYENVKMTFLFCIENGLIEEAEDADYCMAKVPAMIGAETSAAARKRKSRIIKKMSEKCDNVTGMSHQVTMCHTDIDIELEKDIDIEIDTCASTNQRQEDFNIFWNAYPKKVNKKTAEKSWNKINFTKNPLATIIESLEKYKKTTEWTKDNGQYIPHASTWLNQERWNDEIKVGETVGRANARPGQFNTKDQDWSAEANKW